MQFLGTTIFPLGGAGGQAADREASSCNAAQLPHFLVIIIIISPESPLVRGAFVCLSVCLSETDVHCDYTV